jgi:hypothetical protein
MRDEQLASLPSWASVAELVSGILFIAAIVGDTNQSIWSWGAMRATDQVEGGAA